MYGNFTNVFNVGTSLWQNVTPWFVPRFHLNLVKMSESIVKILCIHKNTPFTVKKLARLSTWATCTGFAQTEEACTLYNLRKLASYSIWWSFLQPKEVCMIEPEKRLYLRKLVCASAQRDIHALQLSPWTACVIFNLKRFAHSSLWTVYTLFFNLKKLSMPLSMW